LLVFVFFMMSDPKTAPRSPRGRILYAAITALVAAGLLSFQSTEFGIKVAILASLTVACALVPLMENVTQQSRRPRSAGALAAWARSARRSPAMLAVLIIAVAAPLDAAALAHNKQIDYIERGLTGSRNPQ
jgi:hypothetical protein